MQTHEELMTEQEFDVFWNILGGEPAPANANPNLVTEANAFRGGLLAALQTPPPKRIKLGQWLQGQFAEAIAAGWLPLKENFRKPIPAFKSGVVIKRSKRIHLDKDQMVVLIIKLEELENQQLKLIFRVTVTDEPDEPDCLPPTLKLTVTNQSAQVYEVKAGDHHDYLEQEWRFEIGEQFRVTLALNDIEITEYFAV
ncbi:MAG: hypothetical protein DRR19_10280 [Candidatus Parabeggiatoa sp. nov. 1]|nr:MAG: hypothetical protein B6247_18360 [Beggiatoa sp. 4572_84]RKZ62770.1 MAG: hypothetical protein DRR08_05230 [Gammaproteobacteria bacterium]RKZ90373.1 MAG: hypothetical protein DRR19_10280 [Gammaproteobacteria bacterium]